jgi:pantetheine-phosphate adenylyltransferase
MFDKLYVAIANNPNKQYFLSVEERIQIIESSLHDLNISNAQIILVPNGVLTVQVAETHGVDYLVRGIRTSEDFVYEMNLFDIRRTDVTDLNRRRKKNCPD